MNLVKIAIYCFIAIAFVTYGDAKPKVTVPKEINSLLNQYCIDCHGAKKKKGDVRLHNISELNKTFQSSLLNKVEEQLYLNQMPPKNEDQLTEDEKELILTWVNTQYKTLNENSKFREKLKTPAYGNYVNHEKLFSGEYKHLKAYTNDRRWLISEFIFNAKFNKIINYSPRRNFNLSTGNPKNRHIIGENNRHVNLTNPFLLPTNTGVRYYDNTGLNGGHLLTMIANAKEVSKFLMTERQMRSIRPMYDILKLEFSHINTLAKREKFLKDNMHELVAQIYKEDNVSYFPKFVSLNIKKSPTHDKNGKKIKMPNHDVASPRQEYPAIKKAIKRYYTEGQDEAELIRLCETEWYIYGVHKLKISSRVGFMTNYMGEILKRNRIKPIPYEAPKFKPEDYKMYSEMILKYRKKGDHHHDVIKKCIAEWKEGFDAERKAIGPPKDQALRKLVVYLFQRILDRDANEADIKKNVALMKSYTKTLGTMNAMNKLIQTLILRSEFVYRYEFGQGKKDKHGRRMMSAKDASYALAYAITDSAPDKELRDAVKQGKLQTREDYKREVKRMLAKRDQYYLIDDRLGIVVHQNPDNLTNTPIRKLRFFREFFGYPNFLSIFKDNKRFGGNYAIKTWLLDQCDRLVDHIIKKDKDVFKELLTTEKFYVYHSTDNEMMKKGSESIKKAVEYFKDIDIEKVTWDEVLKHKEFIQETNFSLMRNKGDLRHFKEKLKDARERTGNGKRTPHPFQTKQAQTIVRSQLRGIQVAKFFNIDLAKWDYPTTQPAYLPNRKGLLTHPAWLIAHAQNTETDPVLRGKWIREKLLAGTVPDVPITVEAVIPEDHHKTLRERLVNVTETKECWKCHKYMNPLGYTFEMYDDFGRYRTQESIEHPDNLIKKGKDKAHFSVDLRNTYKTKPVNAKGYLKGTGDKKLDGEVKDAIDLIDRLAQSKKVRQSIIRHAFRYFMGRNEVLSDSKTLIDADEAYVKSNGSFDAVIISLLTSDSFIYRKEVKDKNEI